MPGVLACIDSNGVSDCSCCLVGYGDVLLVLLSPYRKPLRAGAAPVHPILGHPANILDRQVLRYHHRPNRWESAHGCRGLATGSRAWTV
jgi:hypothetical protein